MDERRSGRTRWCSIAALAAALAVGLSGSAAAAEVTITPEVTYFAVVKNHVFAQDGQGVISETGYSFLAYVFLQPDSVIWDAYLTLPGGLRREAFPDFRAVDTVEQDTYLFIRSDRIYTDKRVYDADFPNGEYTVEFTTPSGSHRAKLAIEGDTYPRPAVMRLHQAGRIVGPGRVDAALDLHVTWGGFPQGRDDPNGILDDVVFVIVRDCHGGKVLHSGRPYQGFHLLHRDREYVIPVGILLPGRRYELIVDNGLRTDSNTEAGVPGVGFYAQTNKLPFSTLPDGSPVVECAADPVQGP